MGTRSNSLLTAASPKNLLVGVISVLAIAMSAWVIFYSYSPIIPQRQHANAVLGLGLAVVYFGYARERIDDKSRLARADTALVVLLGIGALLATSFVHLNYFRWLEQGRALIYTDVDLLIGAFLVYVVIDATFRKYGTILGMVIVVAILYGLGGPYFPGILQHSGFSLEELIRRQTIILTGIYGFLLQVGATWIAIFIVFAGMIEGYDGFDYILEGGRKLGSISRSGVAQTAVISSMIMGTMMGSSASNVATTGSFTIPLMKDQGLPARFAAATESVASTGGQLLPPIMGAAAFLMADILGIQFAEVAVSAVIPAMLFYGATALGVHYKITKEGWDATVDESFDPTDSDIGFLRRGLQYIIPLAVLIYVLMIRQYGPSTAGLYTIGTLVVTRGATRLLRGQPVEFVRETVDGLRLGGMNLAPFMAILGSLGIAINIVSVTGLAQKIAVNMVILAGGVLIGVLFLGMVVSLLFGLGMPTPAAYVLVATILAPGIIEAGVPALSAHMFVFYFALLSALTPPVALAVAIGVGISGSDFIKTALEAMRLGGAAFVIPFVWIFNPEILFWTFPDTLIVTGVLAVGTLALVSAAIGYNGHRALTGWERLLNASLFLAAAFAPAVLSDGFAIPFQIAVAVLILLANWVVLPRIAALRPDV